MLPPLENGSPDLEGAGWERVIRGGSWGYNARHVRAAYRSWGHPGYRNFNLGFRLVRSTP